MLKCGELKRARAALAKLILQIDELMQEKRNSSVLAMSFLH